MNQISFIQKELDNNPQASLSLYQCGWEQCKIGHSYGPAVRDHYLIHYIVNGKGTYVVGDKEYQLKKGDGFLIEPYVSTIYYADLTDPWEYYWIGFSGIEAERILKTLKLCGEHLIFHYSDTDQLGQHLRITIQNNRPGNEFLKLSRLYGFFSYLQEEHQNNQAGTENSYIKLAVDYMLKNYSYGITVKMVADYLGLNRSYFYKIFLSSTGKSPQQYLLDLRLDKAKSLLINNDLNVTQTAYSCGFNDITHFSNIFKNKFGVSPLKYKNQGG